MLALARNFWTDSGNLFEYDPGHFVEGCRKPDERGAVKDQIQPDREADKPDTRNRHLRQQHDSQPQRNNSRKHGPAPARKLQYPCPNRAEDTSNNEEGSKDQSEAGCPSDGGPD